MIKKIIIFVALFFFIQNPTYATDVVKVDNLAISSAWSRASTGIKRPSAIYLSITNTSSAHERLTEAHTPNAKRAELHRHFMDNGVIRMRQVKNVEIPAVSTTMLKPSGFHIMLFDLKSLLKEGDIFPVNLTFEKAGNATVMVHVTGVGSSKAHKKSTNNLHDLKSKDHEKHNATHMKHGSTPAQ
jgi:periplasmic copper chaperone A